MKLVFSIVMLGFVSSCSSDEWDKSDQDKLMERCQQEGGSKSYCKCYLSKAMEVYPNARDMKDIDFESAVEISTYCK